MVATLKDYVGDTRLNHLVETIGDCKDEFLDVHEYTSRTEDHNAR